MKDKFILGSCILCTTLLMSCNQANPQEAAGATNTNLSTLSQYDESVYNEAGLDGELARFAKEVPGFGGFSTDKDGTLNFFAKNPGRDSNILTKLRNEALSITQLRQKSAKNTPIKFDSTSFRIVKGKYDYRELVKSRKLMRSLFESSGISLLDIAEDKNLIEVTVASQGSLERVKSKIKNMGIPDDMFNINISMPSEFTRTLRDKANPNFPLVAGLQIYTQGYCTLGANAYINGEYGLITASHCVPPTGSVSTSPQKVWQPAFDAYDNNLVGHEKYDPNTFSCLNSTTCRYSDIAFIAYDTSSYSQFGSIAALPTLSSRNYIDLNIYDNQFFNITNDSLNANIGDAIYKIGRTTGYQSGNVTQTCVDNKPANQSTLFLCQTIANTYNDGGDSGGPIFSANSDGSVTFLGITSSRDSLFNTIYSPLWGFSQDLNATVRVSN